MVDEVHLHLIDLAAIAVLDNAVPLNVLITVVCIFFIPNFQSFSNLKSLSDLTVSGH